MKKKIISGMLSVLMLASVSVSNLAFAENSATTPAISFVDESGNAVTSAPDLGKIKIADIGGAGAKFFATYDKDGRFREMSSLDEAVYVNEWAEDTYVKAFAFDSLDGIKSIAPAKKVELSTEGKELIVSYADGAIEVPDEMWNNKTKSSEQTYGNAKYSAKLKSCVSRAAKLSDSNKTALKNGTYNVVKVRYYVGNVTTNRFNFVLAEENVYGDKGSGTNKTPCPYMYATVVPEKTGWNVAVINLDTLKQYYSDHALNIKDATYWDIMSGGANSVLWGNDPPTNAIDSLYIDSVWFDNVKLESDHAIDFSSDNDWNVVTVNHLTKSTEQKYGTATRSAKVTGTTGNEIGFFDLARMGFTTDWSKYKVLKVRYYTNDVSCVPGVYMATYQGWVTSNGDVYRGNTKLAENQGSYIMNNCFTDKKPAQVGWNTVSYILPNGTTATDDLSVRKNITLLNVPYLKIFSDQYSQYWGVPNDGKQHTQGTDYSNEIKDKVYIDKIWLEEDLKLDDETMIDFGDYYTWSVMGSMKQFKKNTDMKAVGKKLSAEMYTTTANTTGFFDLAKIGFTTNWSDYKTINIKYYTDDVNKVPAVYMATEQNWVVWNSTTDGSFRVKSGKYESKKPTATGWNTVTFNLSDDFTRNQTKSGSYQIGWNEIKYLQVRNHDPAQSWNEQSAPYTDLTGIYIDSIWLSK